MAKLIMICAGIDTGKRKLRCWFLPTQLGFYVFCEGKVSFWKPLPTQLGYGIASPGTIGQNWIGFSLLKRSFHFASSIPGLSADDGARSAHWIV